MSQTEKHNRRSFFNSIRTRLTLTFIGLATVPLLLIGIVLGYRSFQTQQQEAIDTQQARGDQIATEIETIVEKLELNLRFLVEVRRITEVPTEEQRSLLQETRFFETAFDELILLSPDGQVLQSVSRFGGSSLEDYTNQAVFTAPLQERTTYYSPIEFDVNTGEPLMTIAIPISRRGEFQGVLVAETRVKAIQDVIIALDIADGEDIYIVDSQSRIVAHRDLTKVLNEDTFDVPNKAGIATGLGGENVVLATAKITLNDQELIVVTEKSTSEALADSINNVLIVVAITLFAVAVAAALGFGAVQQIVRPITQLASTAQKIEEGDLEQRVDVKSADEIGDLARSFNSMTNQLRQTVQNLEQIVEDRTLDLQLAVEMSRQISTQLDPAKLVNELVNMTKQSFNLYGVHVFLLDEEHQQLVLRAGAGDYTDGQLPTETVLDMNAKPSLIAETARSKQIVNVKDVRHSQDYLAISNLPEVRSEMGVPIVRGDRLYGVLDLCSQEADRFQENDERVMSIFARNVAVAFENGQLFAEARVAREDAEKANRIKSQFLANMSHELRTPLNAILNFTEFVADGVLGEVNEKQIETLQKAISSGEHLLSLINDILDLTKIEVGMMELFIQDVDLNKTLESVLATTKGLVKNKPEVTLESEIEENLPVLQGDKRRLRQVFLNLLSNAVKFTPKGTIKLKAYTENEEIVVYIKDSGIGIAPEDLQMVFESFRQAEKALSAAAGTGLGLPISQHFVEAHGGRIWLESEVNVGSTFYVALPIQAPANIATADTSSPAEN